MKGALLLFSLLCCFLTVYGTCDPQANAQFISNCGWSDADRQAIVKAHNDLRNKMASGGEKDFKKAENMRGLTYDMDLEKGAMTHVNLCLNVHSHPPAGVYGDNYGQNIFRKWYINKDDKVDVTVAVNDWYSEVKDYTQKPNMDNFQLSKNTGHFTQVCWAETMKVGCACSWYKTSDPNYARYPYVGQVTCNYAPGGNVLGQSIYKVGTPCKKCTCDKAPYSSLCVTKPT